MTTQLVWTCTVCRQPVADFDGYLGVSDVDAHRVASARRCPSTDPRQSPPPLVEWTPCHDTCTADPDGPAYWLEIHTVRTAPDMCRRADELRGKRWLAGTNWDALLTRAITTNRQETRS